MSLSIPGTSVLGGELVSIFVQLVGWFAVPVLVLLAGILVWRRVPREFPHFFNYVTINALVGLARLWAYHAGLRIYAVIYWPSDVLVSIFAFLATYELFVRRLFPRFSSIRLYRFLFPAAAIAIALIAVPAALETHKISIPTTTIHIFDILRVATLIFFVGLMVFMGRQWTRYEFGIAAGLIIEASALLMTTFVWSHAVIVRHVLDQLPVIAFDVACLIWLITFLKPENPAPAAVALIDPQVIQEAKKWEETLKGSIGKKKDSD